LVPIPGISAITACILIVGMPQLGALENGQAASLADLAPVARQSGKWSGRAIMRKLVILVNALLRDRRKWAQARP